MMFDLIIKVVMRLHSQSITQINYGRNESDTTLFFLKIMQLLINGTIKGQLVQIHFNDFINIIS